MVSHCPMLRKCACLSGADLIADASTRRSFFSFLAGMGLSVGFTPVRTWAQKPTYEAMLLSCIDPRIIDPVHNYMNARDLDRRYSQFHNCGRCDCRGGEGFRDLASNVLGQPGNVNRTSQNQACNRYRPPRLWRCTNCIRCRERRQFIE